MRLSIKKYALLAALSASMLLTSCGGASGVHYEKGEKVFFYNREAQVNVTYDLSKEAYNLNIQVEGLTGATSVKIGRAEAEKNEFGVKNGILTIKGQFLKDKVGSGEKDIVVTKKDGSTIKIPALICNCVISTPQEFQDINKTIYVFNLVFFVCI